jgi:hypothetical protein
MIREELEKYDGGFTDEWNDQRKKNAEVLGYKLSGTSDISEEITDWQGGYNDEFKFKKGQLVKDINPDCPHHGSEGEVTKVTKDEVTYTVRNNGKNYKIGNILTKTKSQLTPLSINEGFTKYHIRLTDTPGWYGVWDKKGKQKFEGDKKFVMKHLKKLKTRMGNFQLKSLIGVATKRKGNDIEFDVVESVNEGGMGILDKDQTDVLHAIVMKNKNKNSKSILSIAMKDRMFKGVDKKELLGYIEGAKQFVKYMSMGRTGDESVSETKGRDYKAEYQARKSNYYEKYQSSTKAKKYRAELNQYNRKRGTYGNGDGMDASHKGGKIVGFEKESTNRSRREKSRLKKEGINEVRWPDTQTADLLSQAFKDAKVKVQKVWEKGNHEYIIRVRAKDGWTNVRMELNVVSNVIMLDTQSGHVRLGELQPGSRGRKLTKNLKMLSKLPSFGVAGFKGLKYKIESILKLRQMIREELGLGDYND